MSNMLVIKPILPTGGGASRGTGYANLLTPDPKEIWTDTTVGSNVTFSFFLGGTISINFVMLGFITAAAAATMKVTAGVGNYTDFTLRNTSLIQTTGALGPRYHGIWSGTPVSVSDVQITLNQPAGADPITAGVLLVGSAFQPTYNREWGSGRQVIDTGSKEALLGGGFGVGEGARKAGYRWTLGDLSDAEVASLYAIALDRGETRPIVVVEDPDNTAGLNERIHYGLFDRFEAYERANPQQTRWSLSMTEWV